MKETYFTELDDKIVQITEIAKQKLTNTDPTAMDIHDLDETLDRLCKYHGRKNMLELYVL
tara:strand:+ start:157 stop:336 length:180 start_codon:yes stop_codon:yes gene_type:complete